MRSPPLYKQYDPLNDTAQEVEKLAKREREPRLNEFVSDSGTTQKNAPEAETPEYAMAYTVSSGSGKGGSGVEAAQISGDSMFDLWLEY